MLPMASQAEPQAGINDPPDAAQVAARLDEYAALLESQQANPFRVQAYRRAAGTLRDLEQPLAALFAARGVAGLNALPGIGPGIAAAIAELLTTGRWSQLDRLRGTIDPLAALRLIPGVGPRLATKIHDSLHVDTLEALEHAVHDGRLAQVPGLGKRRIEGIATMLAGLLARRRAPVAMPKARALAAPSGGSAADHGPGHRPSVGMLLDVDREYREAAAAGRLRTIAPRRLNPRGRAWLPLLQTDRADWHFTAMFSNTELAHRLGRTHDWVVIYSYDHDHIEQQFTVVTETRGTLEGRRIVRGREPECVAWYSNGERKRSGRAGESSTGF